MDFCGLCIETDNAPRLAAFYEVLLQEAPSVEGNHYGFGKVAIYNPGNGPVTQNKNVWLMFSVPDLHAEYERLLREITNLSVTVPPERKPWGAYSFWITDPDGNKISVIQQ